MVKLIESSLGGQLIRVARRGLNLGFGLQFDWLLEHNCIFAGRASLPLKLLDRADCLVNAFYAQELQNLQYVVL